jgi:hypothetical protein
MSLLRRRIIEGSQWKPGTRRARHSCVTKRSAEAVILLTTASKEIWVR